LIEAEKLNYKRGKAFALFVLAQVKRDRGNFEEALGCYRESMHLAGELKIIQLLAAVNHSVSGLYRKRGDLGAALRYGKKAWELAGQTGVNYFLGQAGMNLGLINWKRGRLEEAAVLFEEALAVFERWKARYEQARVLFYLAAVHLRLQNGEDAGGRVRSYLSRGVALAKEEKLAFFLAREGDQLFELLEWAVQHNYYAGYLSPFLPARGITPYDKAGVKIRVLSSFSLEANGREVPAEMWKTRKAAGIFRYLVLRGGKKVTREALAEAFWPDATADKALASLRVALTHLKQALKSVNAEGLVRQKGRELFFQKSPGVWVDAEEFILRAEEGRKLLREGKSREAFEQLSRALELCGEEFLPGEAGGEWAAAEVEKLRQVKEEITESCAGILWEKGDLNAAANYYGKILRDNPFREDIYLKLMKCFRKMGRVSEALDIFHRCRRVLRENLGIEPGCELYGYYEALLKES